MKLKLSFKQFMNEEITRLIKQSGIDSRSLDNKLTLDTINTALDRVTSQGFVTPYIAYGAVAKVLAYASIILPQFLFLDNEGGSSVFEVTNFSSETPYFVYFEYERDENGKFIVFCELMDIEGLEEILQTDLDGDNEEGEDPAHQAIVKGEVNEVSKRTLDNYRMDASQWLKKNRDKADPSKVEKRRNYRGLAIMKADDKLTTEAKDDLFKNLMKPIGSIQDDSYYYVDVAYPSSLDTLEVGDTLLKRMAGKYSWASGYGGGKRDHSFEFKTWEAATKFKKKLDDAIKSNGLRGWKTSISNTMDESLDEAKKAKPVEKKNVVTHALHKPFRTAAKVGAGLALGAGAVKAAGAVAKHAGAFGVGYKLAKMASKVVEEMEPVNEVSSKLLARYIKKASKDAEDSSSRAATTTNLSVALDNSSKVLKRNRGIEKAKAYKDAIHHDRIEKEKVQDYKDRLAPMLAAEKEKEESKKAARRAKRSSKLKEETISEISDDKLKKYIRRAGNDKLNNLAGMLKNKEHKPAKAAIYGRKAAKRTQGIDLAKSKIKGSEKEFMDRNRGQTCPSCGGDGCKRCHYIGHLLEQQQNINEISKEKLGRYIKGANDDINVKSFGSGEKYGRGAAGKNSREFDKETERKIFKRRAGIHKAVDKLTDPGWKPGDWFDKGKRPKSPTTTYEETTTNVKRHIKEAVKNAEKNRKSSLKITENQEGFWVENAKGQKIGGPFTNRSDAEWFKNNEIG